MLLLTVPSEPRRFVFTHSSDNPNIKDPIEYGCLHPYVCTDLEDPRPRTLIEEIEVFSSHPDLRKVP